MLVAVPSKGRAGMMRIVNGGVGQIKEKRFFLVRFDELRGFYRVTLGEFRLFFRRNRLDDALVAQ